MECLKKLFLVSRNFVGILLCIAGIAILFVEGDWTGKIITALILLGIGGAFLPNKDKLESVDITLFTCFRKLIGALFLIAGVAVLFLDSEWTGKIILSLILLGIGGAINPDDSSSKPKAQPKAKPSKSTPPKNEVSKAEKKALQKERKAQEQDRLKREKEGREAEKIAGKRQTLLHDIESISRTIEGNQAIAREHEKAGMMLLAAGSLKTIPSLENQKKRLKDKLSSL